MCMLVIIGPTATGKTLLGIKLAKKYNGEIISADSRQVYRGMDIGTGKDKEKYGDVPVWGIDLVDPDYNFNVSDYVKFASEKIRDIESRGKLPIIVGGTILYVKSLLHPPETLHIPQNKTLREELENFSIKDLQDRLGENKLNNSDFNNPRRLIRAVEVKESGALERPGSPNYNYQIICLTAHLDYIYRQIDDRVIERLQQGAKDEVQELLNQGYTKDLPSFTATGYRDVNDPDLWKKREHNYAKRQLTFIKKFVAEEKALGTEVIELKADNETSKSSISL